MPTHWENLIKSVKQKNITMKHNNTPSHYTIRHEDPCEGVRYMPPGGDSRIRFSKAPMAPNTAYELSHSITLLYRRLTAHPMEHVT